MNEIIGDYEAFVANINSTFAEVGIDRDELVQLDHLGFRTDTTDDYEATMESFRPLGRDMGAIEVEKRPISVIRLDTPIKTGGWVIPYLEVLAPKDTSPKPRGIEHAEFVTSGPLGEFEARHQELSFLRDAMTRRINPELKYRDKGISVKFHRLSIGTVVELHDEGIR